MADALVSHFAQILAAMAQDEAKLLLGAKGELTKLRETVLSVHKVLEDAERRAFTDESIQTWLDGLKDAVYDADDIIDYSRIRAEMLTRASEPDGQVRCYSPLVVFFRKIQLRHEMGTRIKAVNERIEGIVKGQSVFQLIATTAAAAASEHGGSGGGSSGGVMDRQTGPLLDPNIVGEGIENDTESLVGVLMAAELGFGRPVPQMAAIAGMGGVGKSTLAQKIYNHKSIKDNFTLRMWVCVSKNYISTNLLREVTKCAGGSANGAESISTLESMLADAVNGKKFLLVLDDVWGAQVWNELLGKPLQTGAPGSRVLITTRDTDVADEMGAAHIHPVRPLPAEDSWALLCKMLFTRGEELDLVKDIALEILDKCGYLPLAIKTIAGVLRKKRSRAEWQTVLDNPAWSTTSGVMGVLYLSYQDLPLHLKQCFIYCSLFPEDHLFMRHTLFQLWVAAGFVAEGPRGQVMEEVANGYYKELLTRSLLQADPTYYSDGACTMHDLLRSLGHLLARKESFVGDAEGIANFNTNTTTNTKLRHLCIVDPVLSSIPDEVKKQESLRTLLLKTANLTGGVPHDLFENLRRLRVLNFNHTDVICLPDSIGNLTHLRFLDVSHSSIAELPESIGKLSNLQYLIIQNCKKLEKLPKGVAKLYNLRSLDLLRSPVAGLPAGIGKLQQLNRLMGFVTDESKDEGLCHLEELKNLSKMRSLTIGKLERAVARDKPRGPLLMGMTRMRHLELYCTVRDGDDEEPYSTEEAQKILQVFEHELSPPPDCLHKFEIKGFFGLQFPSWLMNRDKLASLVNLSRLDLSMCAHCDVLPPLGQLRSLDLLNIKGASAVKIITPEFMGGGPFIDIPFVSFPKLETLKLEDMDSLEEWQWDAGTGMPLLQDLEIRNCPKLMSLPGGLRHSTTLTFLRIQGSDNITEIANLFSLKTLAVSACSKLARISNLHSLEDMMIDGCPSLREVEGLFSLQLLSLIQDPSMESLSDWLLIKGGDLPSFPDLKWLGVRAKRRLLRRCLLNGPDWPKIMHVGEVNITAFSSPDFVVYNKDTNSITTNVDGEDDDDSEGEDEGIAGISEETMLALQKFAESFP